MPRSLFRTSHPYVVLLASIAALSGLLFGFDTAVINGAIVYLRRDLNLNAFETELAASVLLAGCLLGAVSAGRAGDRFGRRGILLFSSLLFMLSSVGSAISTSLLTFCLPRFLGGFAIGMASTLAPVYIAEIAPRKRRGLLVSMNQLAIVIGILCAYLSNWGLSLLGTDSWRWMFAIGGIPALAFLLGMLLVPASPRWLWMQGRERDAETVLVRVAGAEEAALELQAMRTENADTAPMSMKQVFAPPFRRRMLIAISLAILQQISGINTVLYYGSIIITDHIKGQTAHNALAANVLIGLVNLAGTVIAMFLIDRWGRRDLLLLASGGMTICLTGLAVTLHRSAPSLALALAFVLLYVAFFAVGLGPTVWVYIAEIFPTRYRSTTSSIAISSLWASTLAVTFTFLSLVQYAGISSAFILYAILSLVTFGFVWKFLPETRGIALEDMETVWNGKE